MGKLIARDHDDILQTKRLSFEDEKRAKGRPYYNKYDLFIQYNMSTMLQITFLQLQNITKCFTYIIIERMLQNKYFNIVIDVLRCKNPVVMLRRVQI